MDNLDLEDLVDEHVHVPAKVGVNAGAKVGVGSLLAGMIAGADDIDGMDLLRHGGLPSTVAGIRARRRSGRFCARSPWPGWPSWPGYTGGCWPA